MENKDTKDIKSIRQFLELIEYLLSPLEQSPKLNRVEVGKVFYGFEVNAWGSKKENENGQCIMFNLSLFTEDSTFVLHTKVYDDDRRHYFARSLEELQPMIDKFFKRLNDAA